MVARRPFVARVVVVAVVGVCVVATQRFMTAFITGHSQASVPRKESRVAMAAGLDPKLKRRVGACKSAARVTDAMGMIATARVRQAQDNLIGSRPFNEELQGLIKGLVKKIGSSGLEAELPMLRAGNVKQVAITTLFSNRGFCGGYNGGITKKLRSRIEDLNADGVIPKLIVVGNRGALQMKKLPNNGLFNGTNFIWDGTIVNVGEPSSEGAATIGEKVKDLFVSGEVDKVEMIYGKFVNLLSSKPTLKTVLPLTPTDIQDPEDETFKVTSEAGRIEVAKEKNKKVQAKDIEPDVIFDQDPTDILNSMLPLYLNSVILNLLYEGYVSELGQRIAAMKGATTNANEKADELTIVMMKKRQAAVTQEVLEVVVGAEASQVTEDKTTPAVEEMNALAEEFFDELGIDVPDNIKMPGGSGDFVSKEELATLVAEEMKR